MGQLCHDADDLDWLVWPGLVLLGVFVGSYGTLIGAGGGFILAPLLLILYPDYAPQVVTAMSLGVVTTSGVSGAIAYGRQHRIDMVAGTLFAASMVPGAVVGALLTGTVPRDAFQLAFAFLLLGLAAVLNLPRPSRIVTTPPPARFVNRLITDSHGLSFRYSFDPWLSLVFGFAIGVAAALFGVGGGPMLVPVMVVLLRFPAYIAFATSTYALVFSAATATLVHVSQGHFSGVVGETVTLAVGVLLGAQLGALISERLVEHQQIVVRLLSLALLLIALRLVLGSLF